MQITDQQIQDLKAKFDTLVSDKADADAKTQASNTADTAAAQATSAAAQAKLDEAAADSKVAGDVTELTAMFDALVSPTTPPPETTTTAPVIGKVK